MSNCLALDDITQIVSRPVDFQASSTSLHVPTVSAESSDSTRHHRRFVTSRPLGAPTSPLDREHEFRIVETALNQIETAVSGLMDRNVGSHGVSARLVRQARHQYAIRRRRDALIGGLLSEPAWDMLLELFIAGAEDRKTPVKNLCLAANASMSTAIRRIDYLCTSGLVYKAEDQLDARRSLVELTDYGWEVMKALLQPAP